MTVDLLSDIFEAADLVRRHTTTHGRLSEIIPVSSIVARVSLLYSFGSFTEESYTAYDGAIGRWFGGPSSVLSYVPSEVAVRPIGSTRNT